MVSPNVDTLSESTGSMTSLAEKEEVKPQKTFNPFKRLFQWDCWHSRPGQSSEEKDKSSSSDQSLLSQSERQRWSNNVLVRILSAPDPTEGWIRPEHPYFRNARESWGQLGLYDESRWQNTRRLACGSLRFPVILVQSLSKIEKLPYEEMVANNPTLKGLETRLKDTGLSLDDVSILDISPIFAGNAHGAVASQSGKSALQISLEFALGFLNAFEITNIVSLQRATIDLLSEEYPTISKLRSSLEGARYHHVREESIDGRKTNVIQGFNPGCPQGEADPSLKAELDELLTQLIQDVYGPCGKWKEKRLKDALDERKAALELSVQKGREFLEATTSFEQAFDRASAMLHVELPIEDITNQLESLTSILDQVGELTDFGPEETGFVLAPDGWRDSEY